MAFNPYQPPVAQAGEVDISKTLEVTFSRATKVWWSLSWRAILFGILAGGAAGFVIGIISAGSACGSGTNAQVWGFGWSRRRHPRGDLGCADCSEKVLVRLPNRPRSQ